ncbi:MAG: hypothetical protein J1F31_04000 [Erysipelotrichales bacterium]|nr:hypothetical protein [Erysipelotrichales bacterium]
MRKAIVVTDDTKFCQLERYDGYPFLVLTKKYNDIKSDKRFEDFFKRSVLETVDPSQYLDTEKNDDPIESMENVVEFLYKKGFDEIVILTDIKTSSTEYLSYILLLKKYRHLKISFETINEAIQYFETGTHIIPKETTISISLVPFTSAIVSLDYIVDKKTNVKLDAFNSALRDIKLFQRIALLKVESGAVILIRKLGDKDEN